MDVLDQAISPAPSGVSPRKWARLSSFLGALPPAAASRLFAALELQSGDSGLPTKAMLAALRTRLIAGEAKFPPRRLTAQRIFFRPFEDFLISGRRGRKRRARIDRRSLAPIWSLATGDAACAAASSAIADLDAAIARGDPELPAFEAALFAAAADGFSILITHAEEDAAYRADLSARLGGASEQAGSAALHDLAEITMLLPAFAHLRAAQEAFPRPLLTLTEEDLYAARRIYASVAADAPQAASYVLMAIAARMNAPWRAMGLYYHLMRVRDEELPHVKSDAPAIAECLFEDLEGLARGLERDADEDPDTEDAPARFRHFSAFAGGVIAEAARAADGASVARAQASRDIAAAALSRFSETALARIRRNHPVRHAGGSSRLMALRPDIERPLDRAAERDAREAARFLAVAAALGAGLERPDAAAPFVDAAAAETRRYAGDLVVEIRAAEGAERAAARKRMDATLRAAEGMLPADEIALLKERANAAAVSA